MYSIINCIVTSSVNTASRMESSSLPMRIQISDTTQNLLIKLGVYTMVTRGEFIVKVAGSCELWDRIEYTIMFDTNLQIYSII